MAGNLSLLRLPVEVISHIFECMDRPSLQSCCLVSHDFNDIATPILYGSIIVDVAAQESINTFRAFERRPQLRQYVRNVKFVDKWRGRRNYWRSLRDHEFDPIVKYLSSCRSDLVLDLTDIPLYIAKIYYKNVIQVLKNVEELRLSWSYQLKTEALPSSLRRISLVNTPIPEMAERWLESRNHILEELILPELKMTKVALDPLSLPRLRSLNVTVYGSRRPPFIDTIYYVYETLAASSKSLENLKIKVWYSDRIHQYEGGKLARLVAHNHGSTMRSLIIDDMVLSSNNLSYLCLQCPNLEVLGFGITKRTIIMWFIKLVRI
ncbi:hypothetical protein CPB86DRAFT_793076 [Serendipita vermifera]|nr:hypothetical protein CPB86DRAFT_793076 [Serendipita vermifera]